MIERYISLSDNAEIIEKSYKRMITWTTQNGHDEKSGHEKSIQDRQSSNPDIIHEVTIDKEHQAPSLFNPSDHEQDQSGGNF